MYKKILNLKKNDFNIFFVFLSKMNYSSMIHKKSWNDMIDDMDDYDTYNIVIPMIYTIIDEEMVFENIILDKININKFAEKEEWQNL